MECRICGCRESRKLFTHVNDAGSWDIHKCDGCSTQFVHPQPADEVLASLYDDYYKTEVMCKRLFDPKYGRLSFPRQWGIIKHLAAVKQGNILDFGCSGGQFLDRVPNTWRKYGIELNVSARELSRQKGITTVEKLNDLNCPDGYFDVITMLAVIEHLPDPRETTAILARLLKPGGLLAVMTGDIGSFKARLQGESSHIYIPPQHLYFFTAASLELMMGSLGLVKVKELYTDGGTTIIPYMRSALFTYPLRIALELYFRIPVLNRLPVFDTYYGYYRKIIDTHGQART